MAACKRSLQGVNGSHERAARGEGRAGPGSTLHHPVPCSQRVASPRRAECSPVFSESILTWGTEEEGWRGALEVGRP